MFMRSVCYTWVGKGWRAGFAETLAWHMIFYIASTYTIYRHTHSLSLSTWSSPILILFHACSANLPANLQTLVVILYSYMFSSRVFVYWSVVSSLSLLLTTLASTFTLLVLLAYPRTFVIGLARLHNISRLNLGSRTQQIFSPMFSLRFQDYYLLLL